MINERNKILLDNGKIITNLGISAIENIITWYDPNIFLDVLSDDDLIETFPDKYGGVTLRQRTTINRPSFKTNRINGNPTVLLHTNDVITSNFGVIPSILTGKNLELYQLIKNEWATAYPLTSTVQFFHIRNSLSAPIITLRSGLNGNVGFNITTNTGVANVRDIPSYVLPLNHLFLIYLRINFTVAGQVGIDIQIINETPLISHTILGDFTFDSSHNYRLGGTANAQPIELGDTILFSGLNPLSSIEKNVIVDYYTQKYNL